METNEIIKCNKIIAEFMGKLTKENNIEFNDVLFRIEDSKFHSSWDWLMPVIEKISSLVYNIKTHSSPTVSGRWYIHRIEFYNYNSDLSEDIIVKVQSDYSNNESKISTYHRAVVEFIRWYNANSTKP